MRKKNINTRADGITKDMVPEETVERDYRFPSLGIKVRAKSLQEALIKAKKLNK